MGGITEVTERKLTVAEEMLAGRETVEGGRGTSGVARGVTDEAGISHS